MSFRDLETSYSSPRSQIFLSKDIPYRIKCNFSQNINTLNLLISNRVSREFTPGDANPFDTKKIFRKYYGKKISKSVCLDQDFPRNLALACKRVQKLRLQNSFNVKAHFPALRDLNLFYESSFSTFRKPTNIPRLFIQSKQIESFTANYLLKHLSFEHLRILKKLRALTLTLFPLNIIPFYESIKRTRTIQKLNLKIKSSHKITYHKNNFIKLMDHLLSHNKIHTLTLSFPDGWLERDFLETLFSVINMHQVSSWYIQANTFRINLFESKNLEVKKFLSSVDFLWLGSNQLVSEGSNPMFLNLDFKRPPDIGTIIGNKRKILDLEILGNIKIDAATILQRCQKVEGIYLTGKIVVTSPLKGASCLSTLKNMILEFNDFNDPERVRATKEILEALKESSPLETLKLTYMNQFEQYVRNQDLDYEDCFTKLAGIGLKSLDLHISIPSYKALVKMPHLLAPLKNLRILSIDFQDTIERFPDDIPFAQLTHLEQLKLTFASDSPCEFITQAINVIPNLPGLQELDIDFQNSSNAPDQFYVLILKNLHNLGKMKRVCIRIPLAQTKNEDLARKEILDLVQVNPSVEMIRVHNYTWFDLLYRSY